MLELVFTDVMSSLGMGSNAKRVNLLGYNNEPLNLMDMMDDEDEEELM